jgi:hypothetical protein
LWKATKKIKQVKKPSPPLTSQGTWARSNVEKAHAFAEHLANVFQPHPSENEPEEEEETFNQLLEIPCQPPINRLKSAEVQEVINSLNPKKSSGYDLVIGKILKLPVIEIKYLTWLFNVLLKGYFPAQWKVAQIIFILKSGKPPNVLTSYQPINLLPIISKVFEKLLLKILLLMVENNRLIPNRQFGFRKMHSTIEQTHHIIQRINESLEEKQYCSAAFLDISQAFDKVWHTGFL